MLQCIINDIKLTTMVSLKYFSQFIKDLVFPNECLICKEMIREETNAVCHNCLMNFEEIPQIDRRNKLLVEEDLDGVMSGWYFKNGMEDVIHSLKYDERAKLGLELGRHLGQIIPSNSFGKIDYIIPIPLHKVKLRERGYNQAEWIAKGIARSWDLPVYNSSLIRDRFTVSQTTLNKEDRKANMKNAFTVKNNTINASIILIDDVLTTGSTMSACASVLKNEGAKTVYGLTISAPKDD